MSWFDDDRNSHAEAAHKKTDDDRARVPGRETDPLLQRPGGGSSSSSAVDRHPGIRARRSGSASPVPTAAAAAAAPPVPGPAAGGDYSLAVAAAMEHAAAASGDDRGDAARPAGSASSSPTTSYQAMEEAFAGPLSSPMLPQHQGLQPPLPHSGSPALSAASTTSHGEASPLREPLPWQRQRIPEPSPQPPPQQHAPILEIPEEVYAVRKAALQVLKPLTKTWIVISVGFSLSVLFGAARWTRLLPHVPYWFILLPCWAAHAGLLVLHVLAARALSRFIAQANESRQRPDSRDHLNRTEYLPLLQRALKFGGKTGLLSFCGFLLEILVYLRLVRGPSVSLTLVLAPLWVLVLAGLLDGLLCRHQHAGRVLGWALLGAAMVLAVLRVDYGYDSLRWRVVLAPLVAALSLAAATLAYVVLGHQVGYYRLTESQLTAGTLYSLAALIGIVLVVTIGELIPLARPVEIETRLFVAVLAPLAVCLVGMGAWVVSRDEFARLLLYGGQATVHPLRLKWEDGRGWTGVQGRGVTAIPMFGEVSFQPLERKPAERVQDALELCACCGCSGGCYPYEEEDEETVPLSGDLGYHPYLDAALNRGSFHSARGIS